MFGVKWNLYSTGASNQYVALPVSKPKAPSGISGNVDTIAGVRLNVTQSGSARAAASVVRAPRAARGFGGHVRASLNGGTPTRTGTPDLGCTPPSFPAAATWCESLYPNQILSAYGSDPLRAVGLGGGVSLLASGRVARPPA